MGVAMPEDAHLKYLSLRLDEKSQKVIASFNPEGNTDTITSHEIMRAIDAAGFGGYSIHQKPLEEAATKYNSGKAFEITVGEVSDGKFSIRLDANLMAAYLNCTLPCGGAPVQKQNILQEIERKGITATLNLEAIDKALVEGGEDILIASGKPPVNGADGRLESLVPSMKKRSPHIDEHGLADFRDLGEIVSVHAGDALLRRILPTDGEPGETVTGKALRAKLGKNITFATKLDGAVFDPNDPNVLVAAISGSPVLLKNGVSVNPVYTVKSVDLHSGNISFSGTVHVSGDVQAGMSIKASGDIHVDGTVENALLEAGGDIVVTGGIIGNSELYENPHEKFHAAIKCQGTCSARFVQNAHISAGNGIFIHDLVMLSDLTAGCQIIVGEKNTSKGDIIGGITRAAMLVKAQNIGSSAYVNTVVIAGADQLLQERHNTAVKACKAAEHKFADIIKLLELVHSTPGRIPPETVKTAKATRDALNVEMETLREDEIELRKEIDIANRAQVIVGKHIFGGTEICIGSKHCHITNDREGGIFHINEDEDKLVYT
jgi:uncharacterized protein (DUF342 family)